MQRDPQDDLEASSSASSSTGSDGGCSDWDEEIDVQTKSLFDDTVLPSPEAALEHDIKQHGFDLKARATDLQLDIYGFMRLVNLIRKERLSPTDVGAIAIGDARLSDDSLLTPVIPDDPLLQMSFDDDSWSDDDGPNTLDSSTGIDEIRTLRLELEKTRAEATALRKIVEASPEAGPSRKAPVDNDTHYFDSYSENEIHEIMLKDTTRTISYGRFILSNPQVFKGATVLDVGCGTGILSMFAAKAGAKKVYAVEASALASKTKRIVEQNGFEDVIEVLNGKMEDLNLPEKVDVIVSEWMGYMLLYESMLDSVLDARDRFLAPSGIMAPSQARVLLSGITGEQIWKDRVDFWSKIYGFDMTAMSDVHVEEGLIENVKKEEVVTDNANLRNINIHLDTPRSLDFKSSFDLTVTSDCHMRAFLTHFDVFFAADRQTHFDEPAAPRTEKQDHRPAIASETEGPVSFTTGPQGPPTHWQQVAFLLKQPLDLKAGQHIYGQFFCKKSSSNTRELDVEIHYTLDKNSDRKSWVMQTYKVR